MPIYEYRCAGCGHEFELLQRMGAEPPDACPSCNGPQVQKRISLTSFVLKGGGWYKDLYGLKSGGGESSGRKESHEARPPTSSSSAASSSASSSAPSASSAPAPSSSAASTAPSAAAK